MLIGVLNYYPELLEELSKAADNFWKNAQYVGAIPYGEKFPGFTIEDLPWFWSYDDE
jgi:molecular chaperone HtpG